MTDGPVVVTGAASGIGRATTLRAATDGARVIALDLDAAGLATLGREATDTLAEGRLETITVDVADAPTVAAAIEALVARAGPVAALVNAAGIGGVGKRAPALPSGALVPMQAGESDLLGGAYVDGPDEVDEREEDDPYAVLEPDEELLRRIREA